MQPKTVVSFTAYSLTAHSFTAYSCSKVANMNTTWATPLVQVTNVG